MNAKRHAASLLLGVILAACAGTPSTSTPAAFSLSTSTSSPLPTPTSTPTVERTPSATPTDAVPEAGLGVEITVFTRGLYPGDRASVTARTRMGVPCTLSYQYGYSDGGDFTPRPKMTELVTQTANPVGIVRWSWTADPPVGYRAAYVLVACRDGVLADAAWVAIWIWPSDLSASATLPPELLGTWAPDGDESCSGCGAVTFAIGPCSLGERCGTLIEADQPACRFPLVFATTGARNGDFILDAGEDDRAGCDVGWGQGLHFVPTADGTAKLWTADGLNVILHRVGPAPTPSAAP
jgi:hypothetical protein